MAGGWPVGIRWNDLEAVRAALDAGADPNERMHAIQNTPLHNAVWPHLSSIWVVELLIARGADVEAVNDAGLTPLWYAVRNGDDEAAEALLAAGADPWRPVRGGRSAGLVALDGPLAGLFARLPGAPPPDDEQCRRQAEADALIASYEDRPVRIEEGLCVAFVAGPDEDEVIRRAGADPARCPVVTMDELHTFAISDRGAVVGVGSPPGGGVVIYVPLGSTAHEDDIYRHVSARGAAVARMRDNPAGGDQCVSWWRDGGLVAYPSPYDDPRDDDPPEAWLCRFGDGAHDSSSVARNLALMTMLTGTHPAPEWLANAPKRLVRLAPPTS
jgi:hypothetical protein